MAIGTRDRDEDQGGPVLHQLPLRALIAAMLTIGGGYYAITSAGMQAGWELFAIVGAVAGAAAPFLADAVSGAGRGGSSGGGPAPG